MGSKIQNIKEIREKANVQEDQANPTKKGQA